MQWAALLETVRQHRKARPLDGFVIAVNAAAVLGLNDIQVEQQAKIMRARLDEAAQRMQVRFPVYLVFSTHGCNPRIRRFLRSVDSRRTHASLGRYRSACPTKERTFTLRRSSLIELYGVNLSVDERFNSARLPLRANSFVSSSFRAASAVHVSVWAISQRLCSGPTRSAKVRCCVVSISPAVAHPPSVAGREGRAKYFTRNFFRQVLLRDKDIVAASQAQRRKPHHQAHRLNRVYSRDLTCNLWRHGYVVFQ